MLSNCRLGASVPGSSSSPHADSLSLLNFPATREALRAFPALLGLPASAQMRGCRSVRCAT